MLQNTPLAEAKREVLCLKNVQRLHLLTLVKLLNICIFMCALWAKAASSFCE